MADAKRAERALREAETRAQEEERAAEAATQIQARTRGRLARKDVDEMTRRQLEAELQEQASVAVQCAYRRRLARAECRRLREDRDAALREAEEAQRLAEEAAAISIQVLSSTAASPPQILPQALRRALS